MVVRSSVTLSASDPPVSPVCSVIFENFELVSFPSLSKIVQHMQPSQCPLDSIPPHLFKDVFNNIGPCFVYLINSSLSGCVLAAFKHSVVQSLIKNNNMFACFSNFRPISKLPFLSKLLKKVVFNQ